MAFERRRLQLESESSEDSHCRSGMAWRPPPARPIASAPLDLSLATDRDMLHSTSKTQGKEPHGVEWSRLGSRLASLRLCDQATTNDDNSPHVLGVSCRSFTVKCSGCYGHACSLLLDLYDY